MEDYNKYELLKGGQSVEQNNTEKLREQFVNKYCNKNGWDVNNLTPEQLNEIKSQREYQNPNMILG
jgi:hypothetical protein